MAELHARRPVQRPRGAVGAARRARRRDRVPDPRAGDDEHRHLPARARLPPGPRRPAAQARRAADLRRGEERRARSRTAARSSATACVPDLACWAKAIGGGTPGGRVRRPGRRDGRDRPRRRAAGHVQRQPARRRGRRSPRSPRCSRPTRTTYLAKLGTRLAEGCARAMAENSIPGHAVDLGAKGCVSYRPEPLRNYRDFLETEPGPLPRVVPVGDEPRRLHDAGRRGAVDDLGAAHRGRHRPLRRPVRRLLRDARDA